MKTTIATTALVILSIIGLFMAHRHQVNLNEQVRSNFISTPCVIE